PNTEGHSADLARALAAALRHFPDVARWLCRFYRVEATRVGHNFIPRVYGFRLLRDAGGDVPRTFLPVRICPVPAHAPTARRAPGFPGRSRRPAPAARSARLPGSGSDRCTPGSENRGPGDLCRSTAWRLLPAGPAPPAIARPPPARGPGLDARPLPRVCRPPP